MSSLHIGQVARSEKTTLPKKWRKQIKQDFTINLIPLHLQTLFQMQDLIYYLAALQYYYLPPEPKIAVIAFVSQSWLLNVIYFLLRLVIQQEHVLEFAIFTT